MIDLERLRRVIEESSIPIPGVPCVMWLAAMGKRRGDNGHGYGAVRVGRTMTTAHRAAYMVFVGPIPKGAHVLHRCDHPWCVSPLCLFVGSPKTNMRDKQLKGRAAVKLTARDVIEIRRLDGIRSLRSIGSQFGVTHATIHSIVTRANWNHVQAETTEQPDRSVPVP